MRHLAARQWPVVASPAWLVPISALVLWSLDARGRPLGLPNDWAPVALGAPVLITLLSWVLVLRPPRINWLLLGVIGGLGVGAIAVLDPTHILRQYWNTHTRVELVAAAGLAALLGAWLGRRRAEPPRPLDVMVGLVTVGMLIVDVGIVHSIFQRDLNLYLNAGHHFLLGVPVYTQQPLTVTPPDPSQLPFVYPPVTLPFFAVLALPPQPVVATGWLVLQLAASVFAVRAIGVRWRWVPLLCLWPPFVQGVWVGNVAIWMVLLFALVPARSFLVGLPPIFKFQAALPGLWLLRERRWRSVAAAALLVGGLVLATLPLVGVDRWVEWYHGLIAFQQSTVNVSGIRGLAISRYLGELGALALAGAMVAVSFYVRGGASLADLGLASVSVSPTLYLHGLTLALPGFLQLRAAALWLVLLASVTGGFASSVWIILAAGALASLVPFLRHHAGTAEAAWQPLGAVAGPWAHIAPAEPFGPALARRGS
jgi:hypothetical protein